MVKQIVRDPLFLQQKSETATEADKQVITDLTDTLKANSDRCVGMAANMIGSRKRIIIVSAGPFSFIMINPVITKKTGKYETEEGCLSLDGVRPCTRYKEIEDDLDNRAIYNDLVNYIRKKKGERQIILVTHNPNIVVASDAEEVIVANQHGVHNENVDAVKFAYCSGSIENTFKTDAETILERQGIREHICEILEGGDVAFIKRENKYRLNRK